MFIARVVQKDQQSNERVETHEKSEKILPLRPLTVFPDTTISSTALGLIRFCTSDDHLSLDVKIKASGHECVR
jgi:hypothetical protein